MTLKEEYKDIFTKYNGNVPIRELYFQILKWLSKYKNIVKDQDSIRHMVKRIYLSDMNQESVDTIIAMRNPIITLPLREFIEDFTYGEIYKRLRDELLD